MIALQLCWLQLMHSFESSQTKDDFAPGSQTGIFACRSLQGNLLLRSWRFIPDHAQLPRQQMTQQMTRQQGFLWERTACRECERGLTCHELLGVVHDRAEQAREGQLQVVIQVVLEVNGQVVLQGIDGVLCLVIRLHSLGSLQQ